MKKLLLGAVLAAFTYPAFATIDSYIPAVSPLVLRDGTAVADLISFEPSPADALWHAYPASDHMANQSAAAVEIFVEDLLSGADATFLFGVDNLVENSNRTFGGVEFNVLAYHYAGKELVFYYENAISDFTLGDVTMASDFDVDQDLSNIRVFSVQGDPDLQGVASPGSMALLGLGLVGLGLVRNRKIK